MAEQGIEKVSRAGITIAFHNVADAKVLAVKSALDDIISGMDDVTVDLRIGTIPKRSGIIPPSE